MKKIFLISILLLNMISVSYCEEPIASKGVQGVEKLEKATFAGGCFWCMESPFTGLKGVKSVVSGYTGGHSENPTYEEVSSGETGHYESVEVTFDSAQISYEDLLNVFWRNIDPTDPDGQFVDKGSQYKSAIFYRSEEQELTAQESKEKLAKSGRFKAPIVTEIISASKFYPAEQYHQGFCRLNPAHYQAYRQGSGRDQFLDRAWGKDGKH